MNYRQWQDNLSNDEINVDNDSLLENLGKYSSYFRLNFMYGETGVSNRVDVNNKVNYLIDVIQIFENRGWNWAYHAFRESFIWSLERQGTSPDTAYLLNCNTARKSLLLSYFARNAVPGFPGSSNCPIQPTR